MTKEERQELLINLSKNRSKKIEPQVIDVIIDLLGRDLPVHDIVYIEQRTKQVKDETIKKMNFANEEIKKLKLAFIEDCRKKWADALPKPQEFKKKTKDLTEQRNMRCEPVVFSLINNLFKDDIIFSDPAYLDAACEEQNEALFSSCIDGYLSALFDKLDLILNGHLIKATAILWGGKDKEQVTMKQVDEILKSESAKEKVAEKQ
jgi:hypothetical protein